MSKKILSVLLVFAMAIAMFSTTTVAQVTEVKTAGYYTTLPNWKIAPSASGTTSGLPGGTDAAISAANYDTSAWFAAKAPSSVLGDLITDGVYDALFTTLTGNTDEWMNRQWTSVPANDFASPWWYSTDFTIPASEAGKKVTLTFGGISYQAELYINGVKVGNQYNNITDAQLLWNGPLVNGGPYTAWANVTGTGSGSSAPYGSQDLSGYADVFIGTFRRYDLDITDYVTVDGVTPNNVKLKVTRGAGSSDMTHYWVDWHPTPVDRMMGLTGEVSLSTSGAVRLNNPAVSTKVPEDLSVASLKLYCDATNLAENAVTGTATAVVKDPAGAIVATVSKSVTIPAKKYNSEIAFKAADFQQLNIANPKLWWPAGSGDQPLYTVEWSFAIEGVVSDSLTHRVGLREVTVDINVTPLGRQNNASTNSYHGSNMPQFYFNHKPVMLKGGGYCPTDVFLRHDPKQNQLVIDNMLYAGLNMMRDEGKFFDNDLLDLCDENGIVVMTGWCCCDRHQSPNSFSKCERFITYEGQYAQTKNLRQHASGLLWFNGSDQPGSFSQSSLSNSWMVEEMYHVIEALCRWDECGITAPSACLDDSKLLGRVNLGFHMDSSYDNQTNTYMFNPAAVQSGGEGPFGFIGEGLGGASIPPIESMKKIIPANRLWPYSDTAGTNYAAWNLHATTSGFNTFAPLTTIMDNAYGASTSLESWYAKASADCFDQYRAQYEALAYYRYTNNTGLVNWMLNSCRPNMYWSQFDWYGNPTAATFGIAKANEPLHIMYNLYGHDISVINSTYDAYDNMTAVAEIYNLDGELISVPLEKTFDVAPDYVGETTVYGNQASYTNTNAQAVKWAVKEADGRTSYRNGWHYNEVTGEFTPLLYTYFGQIKDAYGVNILWDYSDIEASLIAPTSDVYFVRLQLKDSTGEVVSYNSYAISMRNDISTTTSWNRGTPVQMSDFTALNSLPALSATELTCVQVGSVTVDGRVIQTVEVSNNSDKIAHNVYVAAYTDNTYTELVSPTQYGDNMFNLFPGETRTITVTHRVSTLAGDARISVTCYNNQIGGDRPIRYKDVFTGAALGSGVSLSINRTVTGSGGGTTGNLTAVTTAQINQAIAHKTFIDSAASSVYSPTGTSGTANFTIDLSASKYFDRVTLRFNGSNNVRGRPDSIKIEGSDDNATWTEIGSYANTGGSIMTNIVLAETAKARYVKVTLTGGTGTYNVSGCDIYTFNNYLNVKVVGDGTAAVAGKTINSGTYANQSVVAVAPGDGATLTFANGPSGAYVTVELDGVDITDQLDGDVLTLDSLDDDAELVAYFVPVSSIQINAPAQTTVTRGGRFTFSVTVNPHASTRGVVWSAVPAGFVTVNPTTGEFVVQNKTGTVALTATDVPSGLSSSIILRIV